MSGQWPPEWDDSDTGLPDEWDADGAAQDPEASAVTLFLASVPSPVLPASFETRISAAITAEAAARAAGSAHANGAEPADTGSTRAAASAVTDGTGSAVAGSDGTDARTGTAATGTGTAGPEDAETTGRSSSLQGSSPSAAESGPAKAVRHRRRRSATVSRGPAGGSGPAGARPDGRRRRLRLPSPAVTGPLLVLLFIAGFALVIAQFGSNSSSSSSIASGGVSASVPSPDAGHATSRQRYAETQPKSPVLRGGTAGNAQFTVAQSGISYQESTLAGQVQTELNGQSAITPAASGPGPAGANGEAPASASASVAPSAGVTVSARLRGCVARVTGGTTPSLVDLASYDGTPAYIIAVPGRAWVVGLGCSAANPQEITSVSLPGLSGNLSALGSVEGYASPEERRMQ